MRDRPAWFDEIRRPPAVVPALSVRPAPPLFDDANRPITTPEGWSTRREQIAARWREFLGTIPSRRAVGPLKVIEEDRRDGVIRRLVRYESEPGLPVEAYWLK